MFARKHRKERGSGVSAERKTKRCVLVIWGRVDGVAVLQENDAATEEDINVMVSIAGDIVANLPDGNSVAVVSGRDHSYIEYVVAAGDPEKSRVKEMQRLLEAKEEKK